MRLDTALLSKVNDINRSSAQKLIKSGLVKVNDNVIRMPGKKISSKAKLDITQGMTSVSQKISVKMIYEDKDCIVLDKPVGILTHSKGAKLIEPTVASWLDDYLGIKREANRELIVHRLDRATSGLIICAKRLEARKKLQKEFSARRAQKEYIAIVSGVPEPNEAIIDAPIERNPKKPSRFRASENGKPAKTHYKVIKTSAGQKQVSKIALSPKTGRTHQLRVHMSFVGHPIIGDEFYSGEAADRMYLHAYKLKLTLPSGENHEFESKPPEQFDKLIRANK